MYVYIYIYCIASATSPPGRRSPSCVGTDRFNGIPPSSHSGQEVRESDRFGAATFVRLEDVVRHDLVDVVLEALLGVDLWYGLCQVLLCSSVCLMLVEFIIACYIVACDSMMCYVIL